MWNSTISRNQLISLLKDPEACAVIEGLGVDPVLLLDSSQLLFQSDRGAKGIAKCADLYELVKLILELRGSNPASMKDLTALRNFVREEVRTCNIMLAKL